MGVGGITHSAANNSNIIRIVGEKKISFTNPRQAGHNKEMAAFILILKTAQAGATPPKRTASFATLEGRNELPTKVVHSDGRKPKAPDPLYCTKQLHIMQRERDERSERLLLNRLEEGELPWKGPALRDCNADAFSRHDPDARLWYEHARRIQERKMEELRRRVSGLSPPTGASSKFVGISNPQNPILYQTLRPVDLIRFCVVALLSSLLIVGVADRYPEVVLFFGVLVLIALGYQFWDHTRRSKRRASSPGYSNKLMTPSRLEELMISEQQKTYISNNEPDAGEGLELLEGKDN